MTCPGNSSQICGGAAANSVYATSGEIIGNRFYNNNGKWLGLGLTLTLFTKL